MQGQAPLEREVFRDRKERRMKKKIEIIESPSSNELILSPGICIQKLQLLACQQEKKKMYFIVRHLALKVIGY